MCTSSGRGGDQAACGEQALRTPTGGVIGQQGAETIDQPQMLPFDVEDDRLAVAGWGGDPADLDFGDLRHAVMQALARFRRRQLPVGADDVWEAQPDAAAE